MGKLIQISLVLLVVQIQPASAGNGVVSRLINDCAVWLGITPDPMQVPVEDQVAAAADLKAQISKGLDPSKDYVEGYHKGAWALAKSLVTIRDNFSHRNLEPVIQAAASELATRIENKSLTHEFMVMFGVRLALAVSAFERDKFANWVPHNRFLQKLRDEPKYLRDSGFDGREDILHALNDFPRLVVMPVFPVGRITTQERNNLLDRGIWPFEVVRHQVREGGLKISPFELLVSQISLANHLARFSLPKYWLGAIPHIMDATRRAELDRGMKNGTLQAFHEILFSTEAGYLFELQQNCPTADCLNQRISQTKDLDRMIDQLKRLLGQNARGPRQRVIQDQAEIYLKAFKTGLLNHVAVSVSNQNR